MKLIKFKVNTEDTILFINRVIVMQAESKEKLEKFIKEQYPNSKIRSIEEYEED